jgi:hypothetical protein
MRKKQGAVSDWESRRPSIKSGNENGLRSNSLFIRYNGPYGNNPPAKGSAGIHFRLRAEEWLFPLF